MKPELAPLFSKKSSGDIYLAKIYQRRFSKKSTVYRYSRKKVEPLPLLACKTAASATTLKQIVQKTMAFKYGI